MEENQVVVNDKGNQPSFGQKFSAGAKEFFRKRAVGLKRSTHIIPLFLTLIASVCYLLWLRTFSITVIADLDAEWLGFCVFVNNLFSILILALFLSAFPKRKKPNVVMLVLLFVFFAIMITCDVVYYCIYSNYLATRVMSTEAAQTLTYSIVHIILLAIAAISLATLPLYKKAIMKINTRKEIASNNMKEVIDSED
jgi:hypothetical protein